MSDIIELDRLCDAWINYEEWGETELPDLYRVVKDGVEWITDRRWILRRDVVAFDNDWNVSDLTGKPLTDVQAWIADLLTADLGDCVARFHPCFAGVLTLAGLQAFAVAEKPWSALVTRDDKRVGLLMPYREMNGTVGLSIPVPDHVADLARRVEQVPVVSVSVSDSWAIAAHLTTEPAS